MDSSTAVSSLSRGVLITDFTSTVTTLEQNGTEVVVRIARCTRYLDHLGTVAWFAGEVWHGVQSIGRLFSADGCLSHRHSAIVITTDKMIYRIEYFSQGVQMIVFTLKEAKESMHFNDTYKFGVEHSHLMNGKGKRLADVAKFLKENKGSFEQYHVLNNNCHHFASKLLTAVTGCGHYYGVRF